MKIFREYSQCQGLLLPPSLDEFVPEDHEARIINDVVDAVDLSLLLAKYEGGGAPAYHPAMMLKVIIYAYSRGIYSSRSHCPGVEDRYRLYVPLKPAIPRLPNALPFPR